ncbi:MAG TPA: MFS transporter [Sphingomonadaceae bacterium]|nr:MFS transporter [Sphingomonadaceae bacterium]
MKAGSWRSILGIYLFGVCGGSTVSKIIPVGDDIARVFGLGPADFGWLVSLVAVPAALLAIPSGIVVDRFGPRLVLIIAACVGVAANALYAVAPSLPFLQLARLLEGVAIVHMYTAGPALMMATTEGKRRTSAMTLWATYMPVGTATGLAIGGLFAEGAYWRMAFVVAGLLFAVVGLLGLLQPTPRIERQGPRPTIGAQLLALRSAYSKPALLLLALAFFLMIGLGLGANVTFPTYFSRIHHITIARASNMVALATLAMVPGSLLAGFILGKGVSRQWLFTGLALIGLVVGSLAFFPDLGLPVRYVVLALWFIASGAATAVLLATLPIVAEPERRGAAAALINQAGSLATFLNPPIWLAFSTGRDWTPYGALMAAGWGVAVLAMWLLAARTAAVRTTAHA